MIDPKTTRRWGHYVIFVALAAVTMFWRLLPINPAASGVPGPDIMLAFTFAWLMRRPDYIPALLIVIVFFVEDLAYWQPIGLWPLIVLMGTEFVRSRVHPERHMPIVVEIVLFGTVTFVMMLANRLVLGLTMTPQPDLWPEVLYWLVTLASYPFAVAISWFAFGLRRITPRETARGQPL